jgi:hypothetical protein
MTRFATAALAVAALLIAGCGGGSDQPVEGSTTPATVGTETATTPTTSTTATTAAKVDVAAQMAKLTPCVGGKPAEAYKWFAPTIDYAKSMGGAGLTVTLRKQPIMLIAFPTPAAAQVGYQDIKNRLIKLQQVRPDDYAQVAATAAQAIGNVVEVSWTGPINPKSATKLTTCISSSAT